MKKGFLVSIAAASLMALGLAAGNSQPVKAASNAASLMTYLSKNKSLTSAQRNAAKQAKKLITTGRTAKKGAPSWYHQYVNLNSEKDATSASNIKKALPYFAQVNSARRSEGARSLKVSPLLTAAAMLNADYQKRNGLKHSHYFKFLGLENLAAQSDGLNPIDNWMQEKKNWEYDVKKTPALKKYKYYPVWNSLYDKAAMGVNGYKEVGHYLNLIDKSHRVMGFANMTDTSFENADSFMGSSKGAGIPVAKYTKLVNEWLNK